jgi:hypothetical protein
MPLTIISRSSSRNCRPYSRKTLWNNQSSICFLLLTDRLHTIFPSTVLWTRQPISMLIRTDRPINSILEAALISSTVCKIIIRSGGINIIFWQANMICRALRTIYPLILLSPTCRYCLTVSWSQQRFAKL